MNSKCVFVLVIILIASLVSVSYAVPVGDPCEWPVSEGGNGHYYEVIDMGPTSATWLTWEQARAAAEAASYLSVPGHLATITSAEEEQFIIDNLLTPRMAPGLSVDTNP